MPPRSLFTSDPGSMPACMPLGSSRRNVKHSRPGSALALPTRHLLCSMGSFSTVCHAARPACDHTPPCLHTRGLGQGFRPFGTRSQLPDTPQACQFNQPRAQLGTRGIIAKAIHHITLRPFGQRWLTLPFPLGHQATTESLTTPNHCNMPLPPATALAALTSPPESNPNPHVTSALSPSTPPAPPPPAPPPPAPPPPQPPWQPQRRPGPAPAALAGSRIARCWSAGQTPPGHPADAAR